MANVQIPNLPAVAALSGEELFEGVQAGTSVKISLGQVIAATRTGTPTTIPLPISAGGTGASTAPNARTNLGLGTTSSVTFADLTLKSDGAQTLVFRADNTRYAALGDTGSADDGGVILYDAAGALQSFIRAQGNSYVQGGNFGIGTDTPTVKLAIRDDGAQAVIYRADNTRYAALGDTGATDDGGVFLYDTAGALQSVIRAQSNSYVQGGNFGIGKSNPSVALDVVGAANFTGNLTLDSTGPAIVFMESDTANQDGRIRVSAGDMRFETLTDAGALVQENMIVTSTGNVGIGVASPVEPLHVQGTIRSNVTANGDFNFQATTTGGGGYKIYVDDATIANPVWLLESNSGEAQSFSIGGSERMRIGSDGNVGIGATNPSVKLAVKDTGAQVVVYRADDTRYAALGDTGATDDGGVILYDTAGALTSVIRSQGNSYVQGGNFGIGNNNPSVALDVTGSIASTGSILSSGTAGIGYATGAGIAVTQGTSRTTSPPTTGADSCGAITVFTAVAVVGTYFSFTVPNTGIAATDTVVLSVRGGSNTYVANCSQIIAATSFRVTMVSVAGTASDAPIVNFTIIKGVSA